jgi:hypothetical protein
MPYKASSDVPVVELADAIFTQRLRELRARRTRFAFAGI